MSDARSQVRAKARVFFALWPDRRIRAALLEQAHQLQRRLGGKPARQEAIHLTAAFLGDVAFERLDAIRLVAFGVRFEPFSLRLDRVGCWRESRVGWAAPSSVPAALRDLVNSLEDGLRGCGFALEDRPYSPHVTLVRKARCLPLDLRLEPVEWRVDDFVLVQSEPDPAGSRYTVIGRWPERTQ